LKQAYDYWQNQPDLSCVLFELRFQSVERFLVKGNNTRQVAQKKNLLLVCVCVLCFWFRKRKPNRDDQVLEDAPPSFNAIVMIFLF